MAKENKRKLLIKARTRVKLCHKKTRLLPHGNPSPGRQTLMSKAKVIQMTLTHVVPL